MRPGDRFHSINSEKSSFNEETFVRLYLPILGKTASMLYELLRFSESGALSMLMGYLNIGQSSLEAALDKLSALNLIQIYERPSDILIDILSPKTYEEFLEDDFYRSLLLRKVGEQAVEQLRRVTISSQEVSVKNISKKFSEIFDVAAADSTEQKISVSSSQAFDLKNFKEQMAKQGLKFVNEPMDTIHLYSMAEKFGLDWYALFKLAESTANKDQTLNTGAMIEYFVHPKKSPQVQATVSKDYQSLIKVAESHSPEAFLTQIKRQVGGFVSADEKKLLLRLARQQLPAPVINILIHYVLIQQENPSLTPTYVNRMANDWLRNQVTTASGALARIEEKQKEAEKKRQKSPVQKKKTNKAPDWASAPVDDYLSEDELRSISGKDS